MTQHPHHLSHHKLVSCTIFLILIISTTMVVQSTIPSLQHIQQKNIANIHNTNTPKTTTATNPFTHYTPLFINAAHDQTNTPTFPHDVLIETITSPLVQNQDPMYLPAHTIVPAYVGSLPFDIACIVANHGIYTETNLTCTATITSTSLGNASIEYQDTITNITLPPINGTQTLHFQNTSLSIEASYLLTFNLTTPVDDNLSNNIKTETVYCDLTPPDSTISLPKIDGKNGWYITKPKITLSAYDNRSGAADIYYTIDGDTYLPYDPSVFIRPREGNHTIGCFAIDAVGNKETPHNVTVHIDTTVPMAVQNKDILINKIKYTVIAFDNISGLDHVEFWMGPYLQTSIPLTDPSGEQNVAWILSPIPDINISVSTTTFDRAGNHVSVFNIPQNLDRTQNQSITKQTSPMTLT